MATDQATGIISRSEARALGFTRYFTGQPCSRGHVAWRSACDCQCTECGKEKDKLRRAKPEQKQRRREVQKLWKALPERKLERAEYDRKRWERDRSYLEEKSRSYYKANADAVNEQKRGYYLQNKAALKAARLLWNAANKHVIRHHNTLRKAMVRRATPAWVDRKALLTVFSEAARLSIETGILHHVDHIVPLQGQAVCGLHVPWNIRPLPGRENLAKKNKLLEEAAGS